MSELQRMRDETLMRIKCWNRFDSVDQLMQITECVDLSLEARLLAEILIHLKTKKSA